MSNITLKSKIAVERGKRLRFLRDIVGMTLKLFSSECTVGLTTLIYWEKGTNILTERGAKKVIRTMRDQGVTCTLIWLLEGVGEPPTISDQTKMSKLHYPVQPIQLGHMVQEPISFYTEREFQKEIALFKQLGPNYLVHTISDESMLPIYQTGDCVGGYILEENILELSNKKDCIVLLKDGNHLVRRIKLEGFNIKKLSLYGINAEVSVDYPPICRIAVDMISAIAPIIRVWKKGIH